MLFQLLTLSFVSNFAIAIKKKENEENEKKNETNEKKKKRKKLGKENLGSLAFGSREVLAVVSRVVGLHLSTALVAFARVSFTPSF